MKFLQQWSIKGNEKTNFGKTPNFLIFAKTSSLTSNAGAISLALIGAILCFLKQVKFFWVIQIVIVSIENKDSEQISIACFFDNRWSADGVHKAMRYFANTFNYLVIFIEKHSILLRKTLVTALRWKSALYWT